MSEEICWLYITESGEVTGQYRTLAEAHRHQARMDCGTVARHDKARPIESQSFPRSREGITPAQYMALMS